MPMKPEEIDAFVEELYGQQTPVEAVQQEVLAPALIASKQRKAQEAAAPDTTMGMSGPELFAAGLGKQAMQIPRGLQELGVGLFGNEEALKKYNEEKAAQEVIDKMLMENWQAKAGAVTGQAAGAAALPARLGAQVLGGAIGSALSPTKGDIQGAELPTRAMQGFETAATTAAVGVPMGLLGKGIGKATGQYTNPGMVEAGRAARRQGITPNTSALGVGPVSEGVEQGSAWYPKLVQQQAEQFNRQAAQEVPVAGATLGTTTTRNIPGEGLRKSIVEAGESIKSSGGRMWNDLDSYITSNGLPPPVARDTQRTLTDIVARYSPGAGRTPNIRNNEILRYVENADTAENTATGMVRDILAARRVPTPSFRELHEMQSVIGKALARARYDAEGRNAPASAAQAVRELGNLYRSIESDIGAWATTNPTAGQMFRQAKDYWRDTVVPGVINNDIYQKASRGSLGSSNRGYDEPRQFFADIINKPEEAKALYSTMDQKGRDLITSLHLLPDMASTMTSPRLQSVAAVSPSGRLLETGMRPPKSSMSGLGTTARAAAMTKPGLAQMILGHLPGSRMLGTNQMAQELGLARNVFRDTPLGRAAFASAQVPQGSLEERLQALRTGNE